MQPVGECDVGGAGGGRDDEGQRLGDERSLREIEQSFWNVLEALGAFDDQKIELDIENTPKRMARMFRNELLASYLPGAKERLLNQLTTFDANGCQEMVILANIPLSSLCAHHVIPFVGDAHVAYIPTTRILGLSKIPRIVDFFSQKLQVQERLTMEIADFIDNYIQASGVIVSIDARHFCIECRGVSKAGIMTNTTALRGVCREPGVKSEFLAHISRLNKTT